MRQVGFLLYQRRPNQNFFHAHTEVLRLLKPLRVKLLLKLGKNLLYQLLAGHVLRQIVCIRENVSFQLIKYLFCRWQLIFINKIRSSIFHCHQELFLTHDAFLFQLLSDHRNGIPFRNGKGFLLFLRPVGHQRLYHIGQAHAVIECKGAVPQLPSVIRKINLQQKGRLIADHTGVLQFFRHLSRTASLSDGHLHRLSFHGLRPGILPPDGKTKGQNHRQHDHAHRKQDLLPSTQRFLLHRLTDHLLIHRR